MLSRVAENLYWLGRYLERADNIARLAEVNYQVAVEQPGAAADTWSAVIAALSVQDEFAAARAVHPDLDPAQFVVLSPEHPGSLRSVISEARRLARELREHISREVFEEINGLYLGTGRGVADEQTLRALYRSVKRSVAATIGMFDNTVLLNEGREWFRCGLFLERADMMCRIIDAKYFILLPSRDEVGGPLDRYQWMAILRSASALEAFRKQYRGAVTAERVLELLLFDPEFPRSLIFCVTAFKMHFVRATMHSPAARTVHAARDAALLELDLRATNAEDVVTNGLHEFLDDMEARILRIDAALSENLLRAQAVEPGR